MERRRSILFRWMTILECSCGFPSWPNETVAQTSPGRPPPCLLLFCLQARISQRPKGMSTGTDVIVGLKSPPPPIYTEYGKPVFPKVSTQKWLVTPLKHRLCVNRQTKRNKYLLVSAKCGNCMSLMCETYRTNDGTLGNRPHHMRIPSQWGPNDCLLS